MAIEHDDGLRAALDFGEQTLFSEDRMDLLRRLPDGYYFAVVGGFGGGAGGGRGQPAALGRRGLAVLRADRPVQLLSPLVTFDEPRFKMPMYWCSRSRLRSSWWPPRDPDTYSPPGSSSTRPLADGLDVPRRWQVVLARYADLQRRAGRYTVVFVEPWGVGVDG